MYRVLKNIDIIALYKNSDDYLGDFQIRYRVSITSTVLEIKANSWKNGKILEYLYELGMKTSVSALRIERFHDYWKSEQKRIDVDGWIIQMKFWWRSLLFQEKDG